VIGRYRGSLLGWGWSLLNPLLMLGVYTFVFSTVFKARWPDLQQAGPLGFAINLFAGLIVFSLFSECVSRAPTLVLSQPSYVTKVVFPLEILSGVAVGAATFHACTSLVVLAGFELIATGMIPATALWLPLVWMPLILGCLALCWLLSALGVFLREPPTARGREPEHVDVSECGILSNLSITRTLATAASCQPAGTGD